MNVCFMFQMRFRHLFFYLGVRCSGGGFITCALAERGGGEKNVSHSHFLSRLSRPIKIALRSHSLKLGRGRETVRQLHSGNWKNSLRSDPATLHQKCSWATNNETWPCAIEKPKMDETKTKLVLHMCNRYEISIKGKERSEPTPVDKYWKT